MISEVERYIYSGSEKPTPPTNSKTPSPAEKYLYRKKPLTPKNIEKPFFTPSLLEEFEKRKKEIEEKFGEILTKEGFLKLLLEKSYLIFEENGGSVKKDKNNGGNNGNGGNGSTPGLEEKDKELLKTIKPRRRNKCKECGGAIVNDPNGGRACDKCGIFVSEDTQFDFRDPPNYTTNPAVSKSHHAPTTNRIANKGLGTTIPYNLKNLNSKKVLKQDIPYSEKALKDGITEIERISSLLNLKQDVKDETISLLRLYKEHNIRQGYKLEHLITCLLYLALRRLRIPVSINKLGEVAGVSKKTIYKSSKLIADKLDVKIQHIPPEEYIPGICSKISQGIEIENRAKELIKHVKATNPLIIAGASVYAAMREVGVRSYTQEEIAEIAGCSGVSLALGYRELEKILKVGVK